MRLYLSFIGPFSEEISWNSNNIIGVRRFLEKVWRLSEKVGPPAGEARGGDSDPSLHATIKKVTEDVANFRFNTAVSAMMIQVNAWDKLEVINKADYETLLKLLAPFAPHATDELWEQLGHNESIHLAKWPEYDINKTESTNFLLVVQVAGKVRGTVALGAAATEAEAKAAALSLPEVTKWLNETEPKKIIYVPGRVINFIP
jgi:leucyl-tRNA synthetase